jgi:hypothetical protein
MAQYLPQIPPQVQEDLLPYISEEFLRVAQSLNTILAGQYEVNHQMPPRVKPGLVLYFDGTQANPDGSGREGLYRYTVGHVWTYIG